MKLELMRCPDLLVRPFNIIDLSIPLDSERGAYVSLSDLSSVYQPYSSPVDPSEECHPICAASQTPSSVLLSSLPRLKRHLPPMELPLPSSSAASTSTNPFSGFTDRESLQTALEKELVEQDGWLKPRVEYVKAKWTQVRQPLFLPLGLLQSCGDAETRGCFCCRLRILMTFPRSLARMSLLCEWTPRF